MRVLVALGGNAMTGPDGSAAPHDQVAAIERAAGPLADVVTRRISCLPGITETETLVAFQAFSRHDLEAMWSVGLE